jgi:hypothetical protein
MKEKEKEKASDACTINIKFVIGVGVHLFLHSFMVKLLAFLRFWRHHFCHLFIILLCSLVVF